MKQRIARVLCAAVLAAAALAVARSASAQVPEPAAAERRLLVLTDAGEPPPSGLLLALRVQLGPTVRVEARTVPARLDLAAHTQAATAIMATERAQAAVWTEAVEGGLRVYVWRAASEGSPQLATGQAPGAPGPDMDRTLALKVSEVLDGPRPHAAEAGVTPPLPAAEQRQLWTWGIVGQLAAVALPSAGPGFGQLGPAIAVGATLGRPTLRCAALFDLTWLPPKRTQAGSNVEVDIQELTPALRVKAEAALGAVWLGAHAALAISILHAQGWNAQGEHGEATKTPTSWLAGLGVEVPLMTAFGLGFDLGVQGQLRRQRFSIEGAEVADSKRLRPLGRIAISFRPGERR